MIIPDSNKLMADLKYLVNKLMHQNCSCSCSGSSSSTLTSSSGSSSRSSRRRRPPSHNTPPLSHYNYPASIWPVSPAPRNPCECFAMLLETQAALEHELLAKSSVQRELRVWQRQHQDTRELKAQVQGHLKEIAQLKKALKVQTEATARAERKSLETAANGVETETMTDELRRLRKRAKNESKAVRKLKKTLEMETLKSLEMEKDRDSHQRIYAETWGRLIRTEAECTQLKELNDRLQQQLPPEAAPEAAPAAAQPPLQPGNNRTPRLPQRLRHMGEQQQMSLAWDQAVHQRNRYRDICIELQAELLHKVFLPYAGQWLRGIPDGPMLRFGYDVRPYLGNARQMLLMRRDLVARMQQMMQTVRLRRNRMSNMFWALIRMEERLTMAEAEDERLMRPVWDYENYAYFVQAIGQYGLYAM